MKCLICHDSKLYYDNGKYYKTTMGGKHYTRYLQISNSLKLLMRTESVKLEDTNKLNEVSLPNSEIVSCPSIMTLKGLLINKHKAKKIISNEIDATDFLVLKAPGFYANIAAKLAQKKRKPYIVEVGGCAWDALWNHGLKGKLMAPIQHFKTKQLIREATHVLYVTNEFLQNRYPTNGKSVNCSNVELLNFNEQTLVDRISKIKNYSDDHVFVIGTIGPVDVKYKGQQFIIEALARLRERGIKNFEYHLVGGGDRSYLLSLSKKLGVSEQVRFLGTMPHEKLMIWLEEIDIYAQPSQTEGLPRALIEAMSKGLPSIGTRVGGIPELLDKNFTFNKNKATVNEIGDILSLFNKEIMLQQAKRNYNESKKYDVDLINRRRQDFYANFILDSFK
jgi:glycosyltransferase involved in cell wall biosynthesis